MRRGLLDRIAGGNPLTSLMPTVKAVMRAWSQPLRQNREALPARHTDSTPHPDTFVLAIMTLASAPSMANDRVTVANWTPPRQALQRNHPRLDVVFCFGQCDKKNHGWREGPPLTVPAKVSICCRAFTLPTKFIFERKENTACRRSPRAVGRNVPACARG